VGTQARQSGANAAATMQSTVCTANGVTILSSLPPADVAPIVAIPAGLVNVVCTATDSNALTRSCSISVTVVDNQPPVPTCTNLVLNASAAGPTATFVWNRTATARDNVGVVGSVCSGGPSNNVFTFGVATTITCWAWDARSNNASCSYVVTVADVTAPQVSCPLDAVVNTSSGSAFGSLAFSSQFAFSDNIGVVSSQCLPSAASVFPIGRNRVNCSATDAAGNTGRCSFFINVTDNQSPLLTCPAVTVNASSAGPNATFTISSVSVSDNSLSVSYACSPGGWPSPFTFQLGPTQTTCTAQDPSGNTASCTFFVNVVDATPPRLLCTSLNTLAAPGTNFSTVTSYSSISYTDNVGVTNVSCNPPIVGSRSFSFGSNPVSCSVGDAAQLWSTCAFSVVVGDDQTPNVTCPANIRSNSSSTVNISLSFPAPSAVDNVGIASTSLKASCLGVEYDLGPTASSFVFPSRTTAAFTYRAFDLAGNSNLCFWTITLLDPADVSDSTPPTIFNCSSPVTYAAPSPIYSTYASADVGRFNFSTLSGRSYALPSWPAITSTDNSGIAPTVGYLDWSPSLTFASTVGLNVGEYVVAFSSVDRQGNAAYCVFLVSVVDLDPPTWRNCPSSFQCQTGPSSTCVPTLWPQNLSATDAVGIANPFGTCASSPGGFCPPTGQSLTTPLPVGVYRFNFTATDNSNNAALCSFSVTVVDNSAPTLVGCPANNNQQRFTAPGQPTASPNCPTITAVDNINVTSLAYLSTPTGYNCTTPLPITYQTPILFSVVARDAAGLQAACYMVFYVEDRESPVLSGCSPTVETVLSFPCNLDTNVATVSLPAISATDNSGTATITQTNSSASSAVILGSSFGMGQSTVTFTASDRSNNRVSCVFRINVFDNQPPKILNFPAATGNTYIYNLSTATNLSSASLTLPNLVATDNVALASFGFNPPIYVAGGTYSFPIGQTVLSFTATDQSSLSVSVFIIVEVQDLQPPIFLSCPASILLNVSTGTATVQATWVVPRASDNDGSIIDPILSSNPPGYVVDSRFRVGVAFMSYTASDLEGNTATCNFTVSVFDYEPPRLICPNSFSVLTAGTAETEVVVSWREPTITDNDRLTAITANLVSGLNYTIGLYNVTYVATDESNNTASCAFSFTVMAPAPEASTAGASSAPIIGAAGAAGAVLLILIVLVIVVLTMRRRNKKVCLCVCVCVCVCVCLCFTAQSSHFLDCSWSWCRC
jgi:hypothetical protein